MNKALIAIARQVAGIEFGDLTTAETNIATILVENGILWKDEDGGTYKLV